MREGKIPLAHLFESLLDAKTEYALFEDRLCISTVRLKNDDFKVP